MRILGINASPRFGGNTDILLDKALEGGRSKGAETKKIILNDLKLSPCQEVEYEHIKDNGLSVIEDDMHLIYKNIEKTDSIILASPIFFGSLTAQAKIMIDRFQCVWLSKKVAGKNIFNKKKAGAFICVEASKRNDFFQNAASIVKNFFYTIDVHYKEELLYTGLDKKGAVWKHPDYLENAFNLGMKIAETLLT